MKPRTIPAIAACTLCAVIQTFAADPAPNTGWVSSAAAGLTLTRGNSETLLGTVNIATAKKWDQNEISLGVDGTYGKNKESDGTDRTSAESVRAFGQYNRLFNERLYGYVRLEGLHDGVADVDYRITLSPGVGYYFIKEERMDLSAEAGPGFIYERVGGEEKGYLVARLAEKFNFKINDRARIWQSVEFLPQVDNFENYILNSELGIESDLTAKLSLRSYVQDTYDNQPAPGRKQNDLKWVTAIAYKF